MTKYVAGYTGPMLPAAPPRDNVMTPTLGSPGMGRGPMGRGPRGPMGGPGRPMPSRMKKGGSVKSSASKRADGIATKGKTRGKMV
jgi:hypothetical protein